MARNNVDLDAEACDGVTKRYRLRTKCDAVNLALRKLAAEPLMVEEARGLRGSGGDGDLEIARGSRGA